MKGKGKRAKGKRTAQLAIARCDLGGVQTSISASHSVPLPFALFPLPLRHGDGVDDQAKASFKDGVLEITVPGGGRGRKPHRVRAAVRGYVVVRDTSGRLERRPVIETTLRLGPLHKRIAVTLTNRGDMQYPMLIGRTALGTGVVVDPSRRYLLAT